MDPVLGVLKQGLPVYGQTAVERLGDMLGPAMVWPYLVDEGLVLARRVSVGKVGSPEGNNSRNRLRSTALRKEADIHLNPSRMGLEVDKGLFCKERELDMGQELPLS